MNQSEMAHIKKKIQKEILEKIDYSQEITDEEMEQFIDEEIMGISSKKYLTLEEKLRMSKELFYSIRKLDVLQELMDDEEITEIMVNGYDHIFIEKKGKLTRYEGCFESSEKFSDVIQHIISSGNRVVNEAMPIVDSRMLGTRINVVLAPVALNGPILTIRRFPQKPILMEDLIGFGSIEEGAAEFLKTLVIAGYNIFISGGTGSGKTTFLNALSQFIPSDERVITIEDSAELQIQGIENLVRLETRTANIKGQEPITIRDLIKTSLRMRPDRIIVGEVRGEEAIDMLQALNTGHDGSLSTGHANSSKDMLSRLETMVLMAIDIPLAAIRRQIASGVDIIVHLGRLRDKTRKVLEISEIKGMKNGEIEMNRIYQFVEEDTKEPMVKGSLQKCGELIHLEKLSIAGRTL